MIALAAQNFLNINRQEIATKINDLLEGNIREIVGQMKLTEMVSDRKAFGEKVQANVVPDLARFGLELVSFNVQNFSDEGGVIDNLGIDNVEQIRKNAAIAKSDAKREIAIAEAENDKASNDAKVKAATEIAKKQTEFAIEKAAMQERADTAQAKADAAKQIEAENQRKAREIAEAEANLARQEKAIELQEREVAIKERKLEADVKKTAEAQKYAEQQAAEAKAYAANKAAEAALFERERKAEAARIEAEKKAAADLALATAEAEAQKRLAEAIRAQGEAEAAAEEAKGLARAKAIQAEAEAEAKGMLEKAEALKQYGDAARQQMELDAVKVLYEQLPAIAEAIGKGYQGANIHVIGNDAGQLAGNMMSGITQITEGFKGATGMDLNSIVGGMLGAKIADNGNN
jgi:flotillin